MTQTRLKTRRSWNRRTKSLVWTATGILLPLSYLAWHIFGWPAPIRISYETTRLTSPLTTDGYVDYLRVFRESQPADVGDYRDNPWFALMENERDAVRSPNDPARNRPHPRGTENIVYRDPVEALREHLQKNKSAIEAYAEVHEFQEHALENRMRIPFSSTDDPVLASVVEDNAEWYNAVVTTFNPTPLPGGFPDAADQRGAQTLANLRLEIHQDCRELARRFRLRSMYRAGQGDLQGSFDDIAFTWRIAARCDHCCVVSNGIATAIELQASQANIKQVLAANELTAALCSQIKNLPHESTYNQLVQLIDETERYIWLDVVQGLHAGHCDSASMQTFSGIQYTGSLGKLRSRRLWHATNWNQILMKQNQRFDALVSALRLPTWREQHLAMQTFWHDPKQTESYDIESALPWSVSDPTNAMTRLILPDWNWSDAPPELAHLRDLRRRVVQIVARLAMWRQVHGQFPDDLQSTLTVDGFSTAKPELLADPFTGSQLAYQKQLNGFVLSSVGPNMQKDGAGFEECAIHESDLSDRNRPEDDHIWRWPPAE